MTTQFDAKIRSKNYDTNDDNGRVEEHSRLLRSIENNDVGDDGRERRSSDLRTERREEISRERRSEIHPERSLRRSNERKGQRRTNVEMRERAGLQSRENRSERGRIYERNIPTQGRNNVEMRERAKIQTLRDSPPTRHPHWPRQTTRPLPKVQSIPTNQPQHHKTPTH